jgi:DNA-binding IscR family transcriptional regulator
LPVYGNHGGYRLNKELSEISLLKLNESLVGPVQVASCLEPGRETCPVKHGCTIASPMNLLNQRIVQLFQDTTLETLARTGSA